MPDPSAVAASAASKVSETAGSPQASADIMRGVAATAEKALLADLSPPAQVLVTALDAGLGVAAGLGAPISEIATGALVSLASSISLEVGNIVAEIAGDIASAIPVVGPIIKALVVIVTIFINAFKKPDDGAECQRLFQLYQPKPTGSTGAVPTDIFARNQGIEWWYADPFDDKSAADYRRSLKDFWSYGVPNTFIPFGGTRCRSALGMALMQITEGTIFDIRELDHLTAADIEKITDRAADADKPKLATPALVRDLWGKALDRDARLAPKQWAHAHPGAHAHRPMPGLPPAWRNRFRRLRRAIEASGTGSDGGVHLWIIYQDLLVGAFERGYLTKAYVEFLFTRQTSFARAFKLADPSSEHWVRRHVTEPLLAETADGDIIASDNMTAAPPTWIWRFSPCPEMVTANILDLVDKWRRNIHPKYAQDQAKIAALLAAKEQLPELMEQARAVGRATGHQHAQLRAAAPPPAPVQSGGTEPRPDTPETPDSRVGLAVVFLGLVAAVSLWPRAAPQAPDDRPRRTP